MNIQNLLYFTVHEGFNLEKNRVHLVQIKGVVTRYQVYTNRSKDYETKMFTEIDPAVDLFIELSK